MSAALSLTEEQLEATRVRGIDKERSAWKAHVASTELAAMTLTRIKRHHVVRWLRDLAAKDPRLAHSTMRTARRLVVGAIEAWKWNIRVDRIDRDGTVHEGTWDHGYMTKQEAIDRHRSTVASDFDAQRKALDFALLEATRKTYPSEKVAVHPPKATTEHLLRAQEYLLVHFKELVLDQRAWHSLSRSGLRRLDHDRAVRVCHQRRGSLATAIRLVRAELVRRGVR